MISETSLPGSHPLPTCQVDNDTLSQDHTLSRIRSFAGQMNGRLACARLIEHEEARRRRRFAYVILTRPDMSWPYAIRPFCMWDFTRTVSKFDWVYMGPRAHAELWLKQVAIDFFDCTRRYGPHVSVMEWVQTALESLPKAELDEYDAGADGRLSGFVQRDPREARKENFGEPGFLCDLMHATSTETCTLLSEENRCGFERRSNVTRE